MHVPLGAALGTTDEVADPVGHGPLEPDLLRELLLNAPQLLAVHVDADGVAVTLADQAVTVPRAHPAALRAALLDLAEARGRIGSRGIPATTRPKGSGCRPGHPMLRGLSEPPRCRRARGRRTTSAASAHEASRARHHVGWCPLSWPTPGPSRS